MEQLRYCLVKHLASVLFVLNLSFECGFVDDDIELERRPSDDEAENEDAETLQAEQEKRRLERMEREKWLKGL